MGRRLLAWTWLWSCLALAPLPVGAQTTQGITFSCVVESRGQLTISPTTISFPDANPSTTPSITASSPVSVTAYIRTSGTPTLKVLASGDLASGGRTIAIGNVTWTASGAPFVAGTLSKSTSQDVATFSSGQSGQFSGTLTFQLANNWTYGLGTYTATATFTLSVP